MKYVGFAMFVVLAVLLASVVRESWRFGWIFWTFRRRSGGEQDG